MNDAPFRKYLIRPFTAITRVRIPSGTPTKQTTYADSQSTADSFGNATGTIEHENCRNRLTLLVLIFDLVAVVSSVWLLLEFRLHPASAYDLTTDILALVCCASTVATLVSQFAPTGFRQALRKISGLILFALALSICTPSAHAASPGPVELPFTSARSLLLVQVTVDGKPLSFILDTGAISTFVSSDVDGYGRSDAGKLRKKDNSMIVSGKAYAQNVTISAARKSLNLYATVISLRDLSSNLGVRVDGILGQDFLRLFQTVSIDYARKVITLGVRP